jgi:hypothetical protein
VFDETSPTWWYEDAGRQAGPVTAAALHRLVVEGRLSPAHRVWRNGMAGWAPIGSVAELAPMLQAAAARPPPLDAPPPALPPPPAGAYPEPGSTRPAATWAAASFEEIPVGVTILLAIVTFGIYGLVKLYQTAKAYEQLAGRESRFTLYFWLFIGLGVGGIFLNAATGHLGIPLGIASVVFQVLALMEALHVRDEGMLRNGIAAPVTSASTHRTLLILAIALSFILVGLIITIVQAVKWFRDWNAIVQALRGGGRAQAMPAR